MYLSSVEIFHSKPKCNASLLGSLFLLTIRILYSSGTVQWHCLSMLPNNAFYSAITHRIMALQALHNLLIICIIDWSSTYSGQYYSLFCMKFKSNQQPSVWQCTYYLYLLHIFVKDTGKNYLSPVFAVNNEWDRCLWLPNLF